MNHRIISRAICVVVAAGMCSPSLGADWPQWQYDAARSATSGQALPDDLHLQWVRELPQPRPAWPKSQHKLQFDASYEPVVMGKMLYVGSMVTDSVTAYDTDSGVAKWRFYTDGPVRFAPVGYKHKLYVASDDGYLYCLNAVTGTLIRKFSGGPADRKVIGNHRLVSMWPARGGPALYDGKIYFAASIWPFMGVFIHALDAETGSLVWTNSGSGSIWMNQPHDGSISFSAVAPQGYLAVGRNRVIVPCGRAVPGAFDRKTGRFLYFHHADGKKNGGYEVSIVGEWFVNGGNSYDLERGARGPGMPRGAATADAVYSSNGKEIIVRGLTPVKTQYKDRRGKKQPRVVLKPLLKVALQGTPERIYLKAGKRLYGASKDGSVVAVEVAPAKISWKGRVEGAVWNMLAADGKLFVVTADGRIYCFGAKKGPARTYPIKRSGLEAGSARWAAEAKKMLAACGGSKGYCISLGLGSGGLLTELLRQSDMHIIVIDPDGRKVDAFRRRMDSAGLYGVRVAAHVGTAADFPLPPYMANLIVSEDLAAAGLDTKKMTARAVFRPLRPYGGVACIPGGKEIADWARRAKLEGAEVSVSGGYVSLRQAGALSGSAWWTHQYGDAANTVVSGDKLVKAPLGLLWFGGPPNDPILPRHGHGPSPQVAGGRLFIEGRNLMRCVDVYTGRVLWERKFKDLGMFYDNTDHQPGAGEIGGNYVSLADAVYVMYPDRCMLLDPATGKTTKEFKLPAGGGNVP
ncbi:MAG: PQQ-binding-like beta-propeller repeat protein, partial [Phycisphaerae bacterium]|nr:PQQ-binding-like beta-propeller repeat protein [Phycisphaerae bacterium]